MPNAPSRILMSADAVGGVWTYALELARGLGAFGTEVLLAVMGGALSESKRAEAAAVRNLTLAVNPLKLEWMDEPWDDVERAGDWLIELANEFRPELVHLNGYVHASLPWEVPVVVVAHSCVLSWFRAVRGEDAPAGWDRYREAVSHGLSCADFIVAPSRAMWNEISALYGPGFRGCVIYNGCDPAPFRSGLKQPFVLAAGRVWDDAKNFQVLDEAAAGISWPILLAGDSTRPHGGAKVQPRLGLLGNLSPAELRGRYSEAAIYAVPAVYEPFGLTALEAALSGCALVLGDIPSLREIWADAACFVAARNSAAWSNELNRLARDPALRADFACRARARALEFSAAAMTRRYLEAYEQARHNRPCASFSSVIRSAPTGTTETLTSCAAL